MKALVVFESWFGNTRTVAEEIAKGLTEAGVQVQTLPVHKAPTKADIDLLVIGAPTHNMGLSSASTRKTVAAKANLPATEGICEWLGNISFSQGTHYAVFDTKNAAILSGSAAKKAVRFLKRHTRAGSITQKSFIVNGTKGPVKAGEVQAAHTWGRELAKIAR